MNQERLLTLWTREPYLHSKIEDEAFSLGPVPYTYVEKFIPYKDKKDITHAIADGWKHLSQPIKDGKFYAWWFTREDF